MVNGSVHRKSILVVVLILLTLCFHRCAEEETTVPAGQGWTSSDPLSIPFRQRLVQAERGNLVKNPSFEQGRVINVDSNTVSYNITGWKPFGENLAWIMHPADSGVKEKEILSGSYAIRVRRERIDESIYQGDGIVSDFIRVIPGNYEFSFWIRLENVRPNPAKKGGRLEDAVDIRMLFYDKNRLLISGTAYDRNAHALIDRSFKALPFSNFWTLDSLGWCRVTGRTTNDPLTEGDIPDEAKYVKLYFGLKGTGTIWIDDVSFRYTRRNFTALERSAHFFDTTCSKPDLVIPQPKKSRLLGQLAYHIPLADTIPRPMIILPAGSNRQTTAAAELIRDRLDEVFEQFYGPEDKPRIRISTQAGRKLIEDGALVFRFDPESRPDVLRRLGPQGYTIRPDSLHPNLVYLTGGSPAGDYYAAATVGQLLDDSLFVYHQAEIEDYPDIPERAFLISPVTAASNDIDYTPYLEEMAGLKLNHAYLDFYRSRTLWQHKSQAYGRGLKVICRESRESGMIELAQMVNPYAFLPAHSLIDSLDRESRERWSHAGYSSRLQLLESYAEGIKAGVGAIVFCSHDYLPRSPWGNYILFALRDEDEYVSLQAAHLDLINSIHSWIAKTYPGTELEFVPPWYSNEQMDVSRGQAEQYFHDLHSRLPDDLKILWSGPARKSPEISAVDFKRFHELAGRELVLMDNSMNRLTEILNDTVLLFQYPLKLPTLSLFDPYDVHLSVPYFQGNEHRRILINAPISSEIMKIRIATAADFMWNTASYDPDLSVWKILVSRYGHQTARELYRFNDAYFITLASISALKLGKDQQRLLRQVTDHMGLMEDSLGRLDQMLQSNPELLEELKRLKRDLERLYDREMRHVASQIIAAVESM